MSRDNWIYALLFLAVIGLGVMWASGSFDKAPTEPGSREAKPDAQIERLLFDNHKYIMFRDDKGIAVLHDPECVKSHSKPKETAATVYRQERAYVSTKSRR